MRRQISKETTAVPTKVDLSNTAPTTPANPAPTATDFDFRIPKL